MGLRWDAVWSFGNGEGEGESVELRNGGWCVMLMLMLGGVWVWGDDRADGDTENKEREGKWGNRQTKEKFPEQTKVE